MAHKVVFVLLGCEMSRSCPSLIAWYRKPPWRDVD